MTRWFRFPLVGVPVMIVVMGVALVIGRDHPLALAAPLLFAAVLVGLLAHGGGILEAWYIRICRATGWQRRWLFHQVQRSLTRTAHDVSRVQAVMGDAQRDLYDQAIRSVTPAFVQRLGARERRVLARRLQRLLDDLMRDGYATEVPRIMTALGCLHAHGDGP